jgi:hypothetical protein
LVARLLWEQDVAGSNPAAPTRIKSIAYIAIRHILIIAKMFGDTFGDTFKSNYGDNYGFFK